LRRERDTVNQGVWNFQVDGRSYQVVLGPGDWFSRRPRWYSIDEDVLGLPFYIRRYHEASFEVAGHKGLLRIGTKPPPFRDRLRDATGKSGLWSGLLGIVLLGLVSGPEVAESSAFSLGYILFGGGPPSRLDFDLLIDGVSLGPPG
jgi:hypothetical protein